MLAFTPVRIIAGGAAVTVAVLAILIGAMDRDSPAVVALPSAEPAEPSRGEPTFPVPIVSATAPAPVAARTAWDSQRVSGRAEPSAQPGSRPSASPSPSPAPVRTTPPVRLNSRISLAAESPGGAPMLLRHRNFRLWLDAVDTGSDELSRADATFVLRRGLADDKCFSLEAVNYPGFFVRHQNFRIVLTRPDSAADATFCSERAGGDGWMRLRPVNYPDQRIAAGDDGLILAAVPASGAQRFRMTAPAAP
jgi:non-reducing end alpha-L-arabinofuranosidase